MNYRQQLANKYLLGNGIEFGALHNPLKVNSGQANALYADKFSKKRLIKLFPELEQVATDIVETDIYFDLNKGASEYLKLRAKASNANFYIANHVIEHLINPLRFLDIGFLSACSFSNYLIFLTQIPVLKGEMSIIKV